MATVDSPSAILMCSSYFGCVCDRNSKESRYFFIVMCTLSILMWLKQHCLYCIQGLQFAFLSAATKGDLDKVKDLIRQGCPVHTTNQVKFALSQIHHKTYIRSMFP